MRVQTGTPGSADGSGRGSLRHPAICLGLILLASCALFRGIWTEGPSSVVPVNAFTFRGAPAPPAMTHLGENDTMLAAWLVSRNARTLASEPTRLFETGHCAPATSTMAYGEPMISLGVLGMPAFLAFGDPLVTYNTVVLMLFTWSGIAMCLLVHDWTESWTAGMIAAFAYAFNTERLSDISHIFIYDTSWTVAGLYFTKRLFESSRWRDAAGAAICWALQLGTGLYPLVGGFFFSLPVVAHLATRRRWSWLTFWQCLLVITVVCVTAAAIFTPYLHVRATTTALHRAGQWFAPWAEFAPGGMLGLLWSTALLALFVLIPGIRGIESPGSGGPIRWAVLLGAVLSGLLAAGPSIGLSYGTFPQGGVASWYGLVSHVVPGLDAVRVPLHFATGLQLGVCVLVGMGSARLLGLMGRRNGRVVAVVVLGLLAMETACLPAGGWAIRRFGLLKARPSDSRIEFFRSLEDLGDHGPLLELPLDANRLQSMAFAAPRILISAYHRRPTSACYGSFEPPGRSDLANLASALPARHAVAALSEMGFTTIIVHLDSPFGKVMNARLQWSIRNRQTPIRSLLASNRLAAYGLPAATQLEHREPCNAPGSSP